MDVLMSLDKHPCHSQRCLAPLHIDVIYHLCLWGVQQFTVQIV